MSGQTKTTDGADEVPLLNEKYAMNNSQTTNEQKASAAIVKLKLSRQATHRLAERLINEFIKRWNRPLGEPHGKAD